MKLDSAKVLAGRTLLLLDFDGPVCDLFAGYPARRVASELAETIRGFAPDLADALEDQGDPTEVLRASTKDLSHDLVEAIDQLLEDAELRAVESAAPTPGAADLITEADRAGLTVDIVSNNGQSAIDEYLERHGLARHIHQVWARPPGSPELMKPDPHLLHQALRARGTDAEHAVLIGDSASDVVAGNAAAVETIGYADEPDKERRLREAGAAAIVTAL